MSDDQCDRGVGVELLAAKIQGLREAALHYARAVADGTGVDGAGLDLKTATIRYTRKLDDEHRKANQIDYVAIVEQTKREQAERDRNEGN